VLDEHQHGAHVQETGREDRGSLGCQELPPRRAGPARRRIDARNTQDLPHGGRRNCHAEPHELAVDPSVSRSGFSLARRTTRPTMPRLAGGRPGMRRLLVSYFPAASLRCQASNVAGVTGRRRPAPARHRPRRHSEPDPVSWLVPHPAGVPPKYRVLMPEHRQLSIFRQVTAEHHGGQAEEPAREQADVLERHPAS
jgi:hypothetical protein